MSAAAEGGLRIATWNIEQSWALFRLDGSPRGPAGASARDGVTVGQQSEAIARVLHHMDADAVLLVEAPDIGRRHDGVAAMTRFARDHALRCRAVLAGYRSHTRQEIMLLYDPDRLQARHDPGGAPGEAPRFDGTDEAGTEWSKPPLEVTVQGQGRVLRLIGVHAKSKWAGTAEGAQARGRAARDKQRAQFRWLRRRVDESLARGDSLIVLGDLNDDPALDAEERAAGGSAADIVIGSGATRLHDPCAEKARGGPPPATAYWMEDGHRTGRLLDYILVSPDLAREEPLWHILGGEGAEVDAALRAASDHLPVLLQLPKA